MQIDHLKQQCQHEGCGCEVEAGHPYCSEYCRDASEYSDNADEAPHGGCGCGHSECGEK
ncbi:MAG: hypothetical protein ACREPY_15855 [Rhodanobacteraceae bacterium]